MNDWLFFLAAWSAVLLLAGCVAQAWAWVVQAWDEISTIDVPADEREETEL